MTPPRYGGYDTEEYNNFENGKIERRAPMNIRCSSLPRLYMCPGSLRLAMRAEASTGIMQSGDAAVRGTDIHKQLAEIVTAGGIQGLQEASRNIGLDIAVRILAGRAWAAICDAELQDADMWHAEMPVEHGGLSLTGTADLVVYKTAINKALVLDYKSGYAAVNDSAENAQILGYSMCLYDHTRRNTKVYGNITLPELVVFGRIVPACGKMSAPVRIDVRCAGTALDQLDSIIRATKKDDPKVSTGPHCTYCPAAGRTCDAFTAHFNEALTTTQPLTQTLPAIPDASLIDAYLKLKQLAVLEDALTAEIKRRLVVNGGTCAGYTLKMRQGSTRLSGDGLVKACVKYGITSDDLGIAVNVKAIGDLIAKRMGVKKADGLSLLTSEFGHLAVQGEPTAVLSKADEEAE